MSRFSGELEFEFVEGRDAFVATDKVVGFLRQHLARGEVQAAARLYEDTGSSCATELVREAQSASSITQRAIAEMFFVARDFENAARVFELGRQLERAAQLYEHALAFADAARVHEKNGDLVRAGVCLERAGQLDRAIELYRRAGPSQALAEALARQGHYYDAAAIFKHLFLLKAEVDMLRLVPTTSENRVPAVLRLVELLELYHYPDQAVALLVETIRSVAAARFHQAMYGQLARLLDSMGRTAEAAQVRARMQTLLTTTASEPTASTPASPTASAPTNSTTATSPTMSPTTAPPLTSPSRAAKPAPAFTVGVGIGPATTATRDPFAVLIDPFQVREGHAVDAYTHLKSLPIFAELRATDMRDLYRACEEVLFHDGEVLIAEGVPGRGLFVIVEGRVRVTRGDGDVVLAHLGPGDAVGELALIDDAVTSARVTASDSVVALFVSRERFAQFVANHDDAARRIFQLFSRTLAERLRAANARTA